MSVLAGASYSVSTEMGIPTTLSSFLEGNFRIEGKLRGRQHKSFFSSYARLTETLF